MSATIRASTSRLTGPVAHGPASRAVAVPVSARAIAHPAPNVSEQQLGLSFGAPSATPWQQLVVTPTQGWRGGQFWHVCEVRPCLCEGVGVAEGLERERADYVFSFRAGPCG